MNKKNNFIIKGLKKSLIASCQPIPKGPLDTSSFILASAKASIIGGAKALRIEGFKNLKVIKKNITLIDYENLRENSGEGFRYLGFGRFAGIIGTYNTLNLYLQLHQFFLSHQRLFQFLCFETRKLFEFVNIEQ